MADVTTSRQIHSHLCGPIEEIERAIARWDTQPLLTWAPTDNGQLLKVAAAVRNLHSKSSGVPELVLAVPFDPYPACEDVSNITDVWDHPIMHEKWQDVLVEVNLLTPPTRLVVAGQHAPIHAQKCLALFTLGKATAFAVPCLATWRPTFFSSGAGPIICADVPAQLSFTVKSTIAAMKLPAVQAIDHPRTSLGRTRERYIEPASIFTWNQESSLQSNWKRCKSGC